MNISRADTHLSTASLNVSSSITEATIYLPSVIYLLSSIYLPLENWVLMKSRWFARARYTSTYPARVKFSVERGMLLEQGKRGLFLLHTTATKLVSEVHKRCRRYHAASVRIQKLCRCRRALHVGGPQRDGEGTRATWELKRGTIRYDQGFENFFSRKAEHGMRNGSAQKWAETGIRNTEKEMLLKTNYFV